MNRRGAESLTLLVAGTGASLFLWRWNPLPATDAFATSLAALPALLAAFWALGRAVSQPLPQPWRQGLGAGVLLFVLLVLARPTLGLPWSDQVLAALGGLLLAIYLPIRLLTLRPLLGERLPDRPSWVFFGLPLLVYLALTPWATGQRPPDGDEPWYLLMTHSLVHDLDAELTDEYQDQDWRFFLDRPLEPQPGDPVGPDGEMYSRHNALLPLFLAPAYGLAGKAGALAMMALLTAALAWFTLRLGRHYFPDHPGEVLAGYALVAFTPPLLLYSHQVWVEVPAALLATVALDAILSVKDGSPGEAGRRSARFWLLLACALLLLPLLKIRFMLVAVPLLALAWWHLGRPWRPLLALASVLAVVGCGILLYNQLVYGNPLKIHSWQEVELHHYSPTQYLEGFGGLFFDTAFGLFACAPLWLLVLPAMGLALARRSPLLLDLGVLVTPYLAIVAPRSEWYGGWSPPFRYALIALPLLGLVLSPLLADRRRPAARALMAGLAVCTLVFTLLWVAMPGWTYNFADGRTYWLDHLSRGLGADVARLFPSTVRPRTASWVVPVASMVLVPLFWWWPVRGGLRLRRGGGAAGRRRAFSPLWGVVVAIVLAAVVPLLAHTMPSRTIELEDPQVLKGGGRLYPDRWIIERTRYSGGWVLREGESLTAPVVPGGERVELFLRANFVRHNASMGVVEVRAGQQLLAELSVGDAGIWHLHRLGEHPWPLVQGERTPAMELELRVRPSGLPGRPNAVILDRLELRWR